ncbi:MAG: LytTR family DNA-binding domain-containing protein [Limisphaerales bacterium]
MDDEPLARQRILMFLRDEPDLEVIGECANGAEAIEQIGRLSPDLVFLDVQMPEVGGFDVLRALPVARWPMVIFATAHNQHAVEAFEVHALDYLLKPFKLARFRQALQRARQKLNSLDVNGRNERFREWLLLQEESVYPSRLTVKSGEHTAFVEVNQVDYIEAAGNYAILHAGTTNHILRETLANLEAKLSPKRFLRVSRSAIVNLDRIKAVQPATRGEHVVVLKDGRELPLTRGVREVQQLLESL